MYEAGHDPKSVGKIMAQVPDLMQRIAGKSIPLEKFVARKAKSASESARAETDGEQSSSSRATACCARASNLATSSTPSAWRRAGPCSSSTSTTSARRSPSCTSARTRPTTASRARSSGTVRHRGHGFTDPADYCLAHLLRGIILRMIAFPETHCKPDPKKSQIAKGEAAEQAEIVRACNAGAGLTAAVVPQRVQARSRHHARPPERPLRALRCVQCRGRSGLTRLQSSAGSTTSRRRTARPRLSTRSCSTRSTSSSSRPTAARARSRCRVRRRSPENATDVGRHGHPPHERRVRGAQGERVGDALPTSLARAVVDRPRSSKSGSARNGDLSMGPSIL